MNLPLPRGICTACLLLLIQHFAGAGTPVVDIEFHPVKPIVLWNGDHSVVVHSLENQHPDRNISIDPLKTGMFRIRGLSIHPSGKYLALAGGSPGETGSLLILNWPTGEVLTKERLGNEWLTCLAFSKSGSFLAVGSGDSDIMIFEFSQEDASLHPTHTLQGHAGSVMDLHFDGSTQWLVSVGSDRSVKIWNLKTGELHRTYAHHTGIVYATALRPSQDEGEGIPFYIATASTDQTVRIWQPEIGRMVRIIRNHNTELFTVAYHPSGNWIASAGKDGTIRYIDAHSDQILHTEKAHDDWIYALSFSPNGQWVASGDWTGKVQMHEVPSDLLNQ